MALVFRRLFQASQRIGGARDEQPAEQGLNQPTPPSWREPERSVERHTAFVRRDRRHLNNFIVRDAERQPDVDGEALRSNGFLHLENYLQSLSDAGAEHEAIAGTQLAIWSLDQLRIRPSSQLARRREEMPYALRWRADAVSGANLQHRSDLRVRRLT